MKPVSPIANSSLAISRLTALWAFSEAGLGGLLHAFRTPFTGIIVGGIAVVLILLIGYFSEKKSNTILRALLIVLMVKVAVSPHSPPPAYLAVTFQALIGAGLFYFLKNPRIIGPLLGVLAMAESAGQKLLTLTILFGHSFWDAINTFVDFAGKQLGLEASGHGAAWAAWLYVGIYVIGGLVIGRWAGRLPSRIERLMSQWTIPAVAPSPDRGHQPAKHRSFFRRWWKRGSRMIIILLLIILALWGLQDTESMDPVVLILRATCVLVLWYGILAPVIMELLKNFLEKRRNQYAGDVSAVMDILPHLRAVSQIAWKESKGQRGFRRLFEFVMRMIVYAIGLEVNPAPVLTETSP